MGRGRGAFHRVRGEAIVLLDELVVAAVVLCLFFHESLFRFRLYTCNVVGDDFAPFLSEAMVSAFDHGAIAPQPLQTDEQGCVFIQEGVR